MTSVTLEFLIPEIEIFLELKIIGKLWDWPGVALRGWHLEKIQRSTLIQ